MSLTITGGQTNIVIDRVIFEQEENAFACFEADASDPVFLQNLPFSLDEMPDPGLTEKIYFFKNTFYPSGKLFTLEIEERPGEAKRVGVTFTLEDLINNPDVFDNIHLKKIAFNVLNRLLDTSALSINPKNTPYRSDSDYSLFDFYDEDTVFVVICDQYVDFPNYDFFNYLIALYKCGFRYSPYSNFYPMPIESVIVETNFNSIVSRKKLVAPKNELCKNYFLKELISNYLYLKNDNEVARFHLYYQVIEMIMEKVFKKEVKKKIDDDLENISGHDTKEFFRDVMRESYVIDKTLSDHYSGVEADIKNELSANIVDFLNYTQIGIPDPFSGKLYKVRNTLFHGYSKILENDALDKSQTQRALKKINDSFELLIMDLIFTYKA